MIVGGVHGWGGGLELDVFQVSLVESNVDRIFDMCV